MMHVLRLGVVADLADGVFFKEAVTGDQVELHLLGAFHRLTA